MVVQAGIGEGSPPPTGGRDVGMRIAVLGMGRMGRALAGRVLDGGHELVVWNRTPGRAPQLVDRGAQEEHDLGSAVHGVDLVLTCLTDDEAVREVAGSGALRSPTGRQAAYVDASTVSPELADELDRMFPSFAAMPVLGSPAVVAAGQATYLLGGDDGAVAAVEPLLASLSGSVLRYPSPRLASAAKLAVNLLLLDGVVALAESFTVGRAGGLSDDQLRQLLGGSPMVAPGLANRFEGVLTGDQATWWTTALGAKDAGLALDLVGRAGGRLTVTAAVRELYQRAASGGAADDDITAVARLYRS